MAKDDDVSIFDELDDKLDDFFAEDDDLFADEDGNFPEADISVEKNEFAVETDLSAETSNEQEAISEISSKKTTSNNVADGSNNPYDSENPLEQLKAIVLEMDWEISDENLNKYLSEINNLIKHYKNDRPIYLFFKLHAAIGNYMLTKKARAHPEALKFLYGVYNSLENALSVGLPLVEKNRMILGEVNNFKSLKKKLFPGFYSEDTENMQNNVSQAVDKQIEEEAFDISTLPVEVQNDINQYIDKMIAEKIEAISKK